MTEFNQIKRFRRDNNLTGAELARQVEISKGYLFALENGTSEPSARIAIRLAQKLHTTVEELFDTKPRPVTLRERQLLRYMERYSNRELWEQFTPYQRTLIFTWLEDYITAQINQEEVCTP